jgi:hypothetical protein
MIMKLLIIQSSPLTSYIVPVTPNIFLSTVFSNTLSPYSPLMSGTKFYIYIKIRQNSKKNMCGYEYYL